MGRKCKVLKCELCGREIRGGTKPSLELHFCSRCCEGDIKAVRKMKGAVSA
ncbi:hypothetical protein ANME2D_02353 [Candidatus Methanoperedens nitroreducens]|uniref:Uncharacterized protein n=1 Tax=Candidatus Methanoperedens nitratireducens TaxID=1392998 RepID=A0A062V4T5_9EURY|nr:hypothetical protein [Candidatus Methanoperedens nitroreducens]KCZ71618.1 hypothetical protein ANME2D_02353 [Candidatus Methanoperedens nitroreducens]MDJ1421248.1 hypothetical protein [Candidatus Methanoperedens sp.]